ncbi:MAG: FxLYD domain-containing protein, partial [Nitrososphaeraceae archaeon]|nr:FxLYD domain-containing protein [Nitrososphaeraceae archaeon]
ELLNYEIIDDKFSTRLVGKVQNLLDNTTEFVKISATFYDKNGNRIASDYFTYAELSDLEPNIQAPFEMYVDDDVVNQAQNYAVTIILNEQVYLQLHSKAYESLNQTQQ